MKFREIGKQRNSSAKWQNMTPFIKVQRQHALTKNFYVACGEAERLCLAFMFINAMQKINRSKWNTCKKLWV